MNFLQRYNSCKLRYQNLLLLLVCIRYKYYNHLDVKYDEFGLIYIKTSVPLVGSNYVFHTPTVRIFSLVTFKTQLAYFCHCKTCISNVFPVNKWQLMIIDDYKLVYAPIAHKVFTSMAHSTRIRILPFFDFSANLHLDKHILYHIPNQFWHIILSILGKDIL